LTDVGAGQAIGFVGKKEGLAPVSRFTAHL
jgi:hypothetical protein